MTYATIQSLLNNHLQTLVGLPTLQLENTANIGKTGQSFSRATLMPARKMPLTIGVSGKDTLSFLYQVDLFVPQDTGTATVNGLADAVVAHFPKSLVLTGSGVSIHISNVSRMAGTRIEPFYSVPVVLQCSVIV